MAKQAEFKKYLPLDEWFGKQPAMPKQIELTFDQVEAILGSPLAEIGHKADDMVDQRPAEDPEPSHRLAQSWLGRSGI